MTDAPYYEVAGRAWTFGEDIDIDQIIPSRFLVSTDSAELGEQAFNDLRPDFADEVANGDFVVAGDNFGSGSSREHAPIALAGTGVAGIFARSYARLFFRNVINPGVPVLICPDADRIEGGDEIRLDVEVGIVYNLTREKEYRADPLPEFLHTIVKLGGLKQ